MINNIIIHGTSHTLDEHGSHLHSALVELLGSKAVYSITENSISRYGERVILPLTDDPHLRYPIRSWIENMTYGPGGAPTISAERKNEVLDVINHWKDIRHELFHTYNPDLSLGQNQLSENKNGEYTPVLQWHQFASPAKNTHAITTGKSLGTLFPGGSCRYVDEFPVIQQYHVNRWVYELREDSFTMYWGVKDVFNNQGADAFASLIRFTQKHSLEELVRVVG